MFTEHISVYVCVHEHTTANNSQAIVYALRSTLLQLHHQHSQLRQTQMMMTDNPHSLQTLLVELPQHQYMHLLVSPRINIQ